MKNNYIDLDELRNDLEKSKHTLHLAGQFTMTETEVKSYRDLLISINELGNKLTHKQIELMKFWELEEEKYLNAINKLKNFLNGSLIKDDKQESIISWRKKYLNDFTSNINIYQETNLEIERLQKKAKSICEHYGITIEDPKLDKPFIKGNSLLDLVNEMWRDQIKK